MFSRFFYCFLLTKQTNSKYGIKQFHALHKYSNLITNCSSMSKHLFNLSYWKLSTNEYAQYY